MKIVFPVPQDNKRHRHCQKCFSEKVRDVVTDGKTFYHCEDCGGTYDRLIDFNPDRIWWVDPKTKEYWHESVGGFVFRDDEKILLIERTLFPYGLTIVAGHLGPDEDPMAGAIRELYEESGIKATEVNLFTEEDLLTDPCRSGADCHRWHLYTLQVLNPYPTINTDKEEGKNPQWLTINEALAEDLTFPTRYFLNKYGNSLLKTRH